MTSSPHPFRWLPPFLVGVSAATAAEVAVGLLLYGGPGLMRSLTAVLAVEAGALGVGFLTAPGPRPDLVDALRRRWLFTLVAFLLATLFSAFWSVVELVGGTALGQGLGLGFLAALPLYAAGSLLGAMGTLAQTAPDGSGAGVGGAAALGAALGFGATGASLPQVFTPASLLLMCLVLLSAGGLVYGSVLDTRLRIHVRARRPSGLGDVRVEDRHLLSRDHAARVLMEGDFVRRWVMLGEEAGDAWDLAAYRALLDVGSPGASVLYVGGGGSPLPRTALWEHPDVRVDVVERSHPVVELGREHMETGLYGGPDGRLGIWIGNAEDALGSLEGRYALVLVDTCALAPQGGVSSMSHRHRAVVLERVAEGGVLVLGPASPESGSWDFPEGWSTCRYARPVPDGVGGLGIPLPESEVILVGSPAPHRTWPEALGGFRRAEAAVP
ncbi:MAG: hypothetical protein AMXMBFR53_12630 [Gemmatimonadota bacterium]